MSVALTKFNQFVADLGNGSHNFGSHTLKMALTNTNPTPGIISNLYTSGNISEIANGNGYTTGGNTCGFVGWGQGGGVATLYLSNPATWTASGGSIPTFRYCVVYNDTQTSPAADDRLLRRRRCRLAVGRTNLQRRVR
jgi:hypothetical protein